MRFLEKHKGLFWFTVRGFSPWPVTPNMLRPVTKQSIMTKECRLSFSLYGDQEIQRKIRGQSPTTPKEHILNAQNPPNRPPFQRHQAPQHMELWEMLQLYDCP